MSKYLTAEQVNNAVALCKDEPFSKASVIAITEMLPSANVRDNIHGEWERSKAKIYAYDSEFGELYEYVIPCSCCGETHTIDCSEIPNELPNFCPNCGADMRR